MNIRSLSNPISLESAETIQRSASAVKSEETEEREGEGRQAAGGDPEQRFLNEEEVEECLDIIHAMDGVKKHSLTVELVSEPGKAQYILIMDATGDVIRRIPEHQFYQILNKKKDADAKGGLLNRSA